MAEIDTALQPKTPANEGTSSSSPILFSQAFLLSPRFEEFFSEAMASIALAADYLDRNRDRHEAAESGDRRRSDVIYARYSLILSQLLLCMMDWLNRRRALRDGFASGSSLAVDDLGPEVLSARVVEMFPALAMHPFLDGSAPHYPLPSSIPDALTSHIREAGLWHRRMTALESGLRRPTTAQTG